MNNDPDTATNKFTEIFKNILDKHAPIRVFQNRKNYAQWLSDARKLLIKERNKLKQQFRFSNDPNTFNRYKRLRNQIKSKLSTEKTTYYKSKFTKK